MGRMRLKSPASRMFTQPFIRAQIKEDIKSPRHFLCAGNSPETGEFPAQMASNAENVSNWWRHGDYPKINADFSSTKSSAKWLSAISRCISLQKKRREIYRYYIKDVSMA